MRPAVKAGCRWARDRSRARTLRNGVYLAEERRPLTVYDSVPGVGEVAVAVAVGVDGNGRGAAAGGFDHRAGAIGAQNGELSGFGRKALDGAEWDICHHRRAAGEFAAVDGVIVWHLTL